MDDDSIAWDDSFSVGFESIDNQHKELVVMANELFLGCKRGVVAADVAFLRTIRKAVDYAKYHFSAEEKYMSQADYPELGEHIKEHEKFVAQLISAVKEFEAGHTAPITMARFLKKWLLNHIAVSDKQYAPYLAKLEL